MNRPKIFIGGDSWGCGEWPVPTKGKIICTKSKLEHKGLEQYLLEDDFVVYNSSVPDASNKLSILHLEKNLDDYFNNGDVVFWIQTDPIRNLRPYTDLVDQIKKEKGPLALSDSLLFDDYKILNSLAIKHNTCIHLIGGLSSIQKKIIKNFNHLNTLVMSWPQLLVGHKPEYSQIDYCNLGQWGSDWSLDSINLSTLMNQGHEHLPFDIDLVGQIIDELHLLASYNVIYNDPIFYPDGAHPNREGHKILYKFIKNSLNF
jgi:hypothetical protein